MPGSKDIWRMIHHSCKKKQAPSLARQIILVLAFLCKGTRSQAGPAYTVSVPFSVSVQRGLAVYIPCHFTYISQRKYRNDNIFAYWLRVAEHNQNCASRDLLACDHLVATNHNSRLVESSAMDRFYLIGDPTQGNCSLIILNAQIEDDGRYYLRIEGNNDKDNRFSFVRQSDILPYVYVTGPPHDIKITALIWTQDSFHYSRKTEQDSVVAQEGDKVQLRCTANSRPNPDVAWKKEGKKANHTETGNVYALYHVGPEDAGEYLCEAKNQYGSVQKTVQVIVQYRPRRVTFSISQTHRRGSTPAQAAGCPTDLSNGSSLLVQEGDSLSLLCKADSNPPVNTSWVKVDGHMEVLPNNPLELTNLTVEDEDAPKLSRNTQKNTTCWGHETGFLCSCTLRAQPLPQIEWEVDGKRITEDAGGRVNVTVLILVQKNEVTSTLNWTGGLDKAHSIICSGSNSFGVQAVQFLVATLREPSSKSSTGATLFFVAGLCGILLGAGIFTLFLFLMKARKQKEALSKADSVEGTISANQRARYPSQIYSNIFPKASSRPPLTDQLTAAGGRKPKPSQVSGIPSQRIADPDELQYAALEFKPKWEGVPVAKDEYVEYSAIQRK